MSSEAGLLTSSYNLIVDSLLGCSSTSPSSAQSLPSSSCSSSPCSSSSSSPPKQPLTFDFSGVIQTMIKSGIPIVSIDIPSGNIQDTTKFSFHKCTTPKQLSFLDAVPIVDTSAATCCATSVYLTSGELVIELHSQFTV